MILSMTAFSRRELHLDSGTLTCECRSVNHRYLETHFRLPDALRSIEPELRNIARKKLTRGKIDVTLTYLAEDGVSAFSVNQPLLDALLTACHDIHKRWTGKVVLNPTDLLSWPGVTSRGEMNEEEVQALTRGALELVAATLDDLLKARRDEGEKLQALMLERLSALEQTVQSLLPYQEALYDLVKTRFEKRLAEVSVQADPLRLEQELVLWLQKADVAEELDRLSVHIAEVMRLLLSEESQGRKLDFILQELNREANTIASKAQAIEATQAAVDMKVLVEQLREQIQNIE